MHAHYVRVWFVGGLAALVLALPMTLAGLPAHAALLAAGVGFLSLGLALGLLPAFARRDWPSPLYAVAAIALGALALPLAWNERAPYAMVGSALLVGAAQPAALLLSSRWSAAPEPNEHRATDRIAFVGIVLALAATAAAGILLVALPRGLPNAGLAALLLGAALPVALSALAFVLPRKSGAPLKAATLVGGALAFLGLAAAALAFAFARPFGADFRTAVALVAAGLGLAVTALLRAPSRPPLAGSALALGVLAALALLLATLYGAPNELLPAALYAFLALALVALASAYVVAAPLLLPGRLKGARWMRWGPALLIAALFLYTPALQLGRSVVPAAIVGSLGVVAVIVGLFPLAQRVHSVEPSNHRTIGKK